MYLKNINLINAINSCKESMNERLYRKMLAKAYVLLYAQQYENKSEILHLVNVQLEKKKLNRISYMFITDTLNQK